VTTFSRRGRRAREIAKLNPFGWLGRPDDIASVVSFLVGPDGRRVNGQTIRADGSAI
jgi:3-oxoacyl-[acyl-carrier protein] reductase